MRRSKNSQNDRFFSAFCSSAIKLAEKNITITTIKKPELLFIIVFTPALINISKLKKPFKQILPEGLHPVYLARLFFCHMF